MVRAKHFRLVGALLMGLGFVSTALLGGCSSSDEPPVLTDAQKQAVQQEVQDQTSANDAASKSGAPKGKGRVGVMPP